MSKHTEVARRSPLPVTYVDAKAALTKCARVDECKTWADKALALKSYAKQMKDESLEDMAQRIRDRAVRRGGELLKAMEKKQGERTDKLRAVSGPKSRKAAAKNAGLSPRQAKQMIRVASVPEPQFEQMVEASKPATVTALADAGTQKREKPKQWEHSDTWIAWVTAVEHLATLPACGLEILAARAIQRANFIRESAAAIENLNAWHAAITAAEEAGYEIDDDGNIRRHH